MSINFWKRPVVLTASALLIASSVWSASAQERASVTITPPPQPDLAIPAARISFRPTSPETGEFVTFEISVRNTGGREAKYAKIGCVLISDGRAGERKEFDADIKAYHAHAVRWRVRMPSGNNVRLLVVARVDADSDNSNNRAGVDVRGRSDSAADEGPDDGSRTASVRITAPSFPDMTVSSPDITIEPANPADGQDVRVTVMATNIGTVEARDATVNYYLYVDGRMVNRHNSAGYIVLIRVPTIYRWNFRMPRGRRVLLSVTTSCSNDSNNTNGWVQKLIR